MANRGHILDMLNSNEVIVGFSVCKIDDMVHVKTSIGAFPIYMFRMNRNLQNLLAENREVWDGEVCSSDS